METQELYIAKESSKVSFNTEIELIMNKQKSLSYSSLKAFLKSPKHFYKYKTDKETSKAMEDGKIFHMAILEPEKFASEYWVLDDSAKIAEIGGASPRATKVYKEWVASQDLLNDGKTRISKDDFDLYTSMRNYLYSCSATKDLMNGLITKEKKVEFEHNDFRIDCRIDGEGSDYIIDLKKIADADFKKVKWAIYDMMYDLQGGMYSTALHKKNYYLIFIDGGINVSVVKLSEATLKDGFNKFDVATEEFRRCAEEDLFQSSYEFYNNGFIEI